MDLLQCSEYKSYLNWKIKTDGKKVGYKGDLAVAAGCQQSYLSRVLNAHDHLTLDHAAGMAEFWGLSPTETEYFIELVSFERASGAALKKIIQARMKKIRTQSKNIADRLQKKEELSLEHQTLYYSSWHWTAVHMALTVPSLRNVEAMANYLQLDVKLLRSTLHQMKEMGIAIQKGSEWAPANADMHLPKESPLLFNHLLNWRTRAAISSQSKQNNHLHYTGIHSLSKSDFQKIHFMLLEAIDRTRTVIEPSKEEVVVGFNLDWFLVGQQD